MRWFVFIALVFLNIFDAVITLYGLKNKDVVEINPIAEFLINRLDVYFILFKGLLAGVVGAFLFFLWNKHRVARIGGVIAVVLYLLVALYHIFGVFLLT